ncbi:hypothetical protein PPUN15366_05530 [Pseudomonas putida]|uniref:hypothetical protein n=1 Tax=Pseudomonas putida TaxID=303 RepID=UPI00235C7736|nr:hypothetical protein [Pseudomonas putida]GLO38909.1 hypothetical protein PPUN15366_05530 [Pseudomonas putida]HDS0974472.1 hypothetical protein [Pseudomonas putida]
MNESQVKQVEEIVQEVAMSCGISFDAAFEMAMGVLSLHAIDTVPSGKGKAGGPVQSAV